MKNLILFLSLFISALFANAQTDLFFSEYCEGSGNNKGVEIYNPSNETIDLNEYWVVRYGNGSVVFTNGGATHLIGSIEPYQTFVLVNGQTESTPTSPACDPEMQALADQLDGEYPAPMYMNGNDAIALVKTPNGEPPTQTNITPVDLIGEIGLGSLISGETGWSYIQDSTLTYNNPAGEPVEGKVINYIVQKYATNGSDYGPFWMAWTMNHSLIRRPEVIQGIVSNPSPFSVSMQWDTLPAQLDSTGQWTYANIWDNLGIHECMVALGPDFSASDTSLCEDETISFALNETAILADSVYWEFPGGIPSISSDPEPEVTYAMAGNYDVSLSAYTNGNPELIFKQSYIEVMGSPAIPAKPIGDTLVCFNATSSEYYTNSASAVWDLTPSLAGTMNFYDSTCNIIWNETFSGDAMLKVKSFNTCGESEFSDILTIKKTENININFDEDIMVCYGESKMIEPQISGGTPPYSYSWEPANIFDDPTSGTPIISPVANTEITLTLTDDPGCITTQNVMVMVEGEDYNLDFTAFPFQFISQPFNVQFDNLTPDQENFDFTWYFGNGDSSLLAQPNYTYNENGLYSVTLVAISKLSGCSDTLFMEDMIACTGAGIEDIENNPFSYTLDETGQQLKINFENQPDNLHFQLFDLHGKNLYSATIFQKEFKVPLPGLSRGMYIFTIKDGSGIFTGKIIIVR